MDIQLKPQPWYRKHFIHILTATAFAACAVWLHGAAADRAARQKGEYGMLPQDIFAHLGQMFAENDR